LATALASKYKLHLIYGFEKEAVLKDINDPGSVLARMDRPLYTSLKDQKLIFEGMIPKIDNAYQALDNGVTSVIIGKAEKMNELINGTAGTTITK
jgi:acetylglutamate kinase